jgi:8-oxo-dGTP pyrophosphatase MutT (NUDIX family)
MFLGKFIHLLLKIIQNCIIPIMHRKTLLKMLDSYTPFNKHEEEMKQQVVEFVTQEENCFDSLNPKGHVTASAWVIDLLEKKVCLIHHKALGKWFQPGGHCDGNSNVPAQSLREAQEEIGPDSLSIIDTDIFDIDVHVIPIDKKRGLGTHTHFDIRFLIIGDSTIAPTLSDESNEVKWIDIDEVCKLNSEEAIQRKVEKTKVLLESELS